VRQGRYVHSSGYIAILAPDHPRADPNGLVREHLLIVDAVMGKPLREGAEVHHVNEDKTDNAHTNLVVCHDRAYHALLHVRQRALDECGNANWRKCIHCKTYDDPARLIFTRATRSGVPSHPECFAENLRRLRTRSEQAAS
jgi:HNH endonuclease